MPKISEKQKTVLEQMMKESICEAAAKVISDLGYDRMTMDRVALAAGVAKGTLYNYFKDKGQVLSATEAWMMDPLESGIKEIIGSDTNSLDKLRGIGRILLDHFDRNRKFLMLMFRRHRVKSKTDMTKKERLKKRKILVDGIEKVIADGIKVGELRQIHARTAAEMFMGSIMSMNMTKLFGGQRRPVAEDLDNLMDVFTGGIGA